MSLWRYFQVKFKKQIRDIILIILVFGIFPHFLGYRVSSFSAAKYDLPKDSTLVSKLKFESSNVFIFKKDLEYLTVECSRFGPLWRQSSIQPTSNYSDDLVKTIGLFTADDKTVFVVENNDKNVELIKVGENDNVIKRKVGDGEVIELILDGFYPSWSELNAEALSKDGTILHEWKVSHLYKSRYNVIEELRWLPTS